jgi:hypothetical protein
MMHGPTTIEDAAAVLEHVGRDEERQPGDEFSETVLSSWINGADRQHEFAIARGSFERRLAAALRSIIESPRYISMGHTAPRGVPSPCRYDWPRLARGFFCVPSVIDSLEVTVLYLA